MTHSALQALEFSWEMAFGGCKHFFRITCFIFMLTELRMLTIWIKSWEEVKKNHCQIFHLQPPPSHRVFQVCTVSAIAHNLPLNSLYCYKMVFIIITNNSIKDLWTASSFRTCHLCLLNKHGRVENWIYIQYNFC